MIACLAIASQSTVAVLEISPQRISVVLANIHSHATLAVGSWVRYASRIASEIRSQILSGCQGVTDSEVRKYIDSKNYQLKMK